MARYFWRFLTLWLSACLLVSCGRPVTELELITPALQLDQSIAEDLVRFADEEYGIRITLIPPVPEGRSTLDALEEGYGDLALASNDQPFRSDVMTILPLYPTVLHIIVREERLDLEFPDMLTGAAIFAGPVGSASRLLTERLIDDIDLPADAIRFLEDRDQTLPDIIIVYATIDPDRVRDIDLDVADYRLLPFGDPEDIGKGSGIDRVTLLNPRVRAFVIPTLTYGELNPEPIVTVAVDKLLVARADMSDHVAYDLIQEVFRMRPALSGERPSLFRNLDEDIDANAYTFAMHPGARAYLDRNEPSWAERYSGIGEVLVGLMVAAVSGSFAAINIYNRRRKNRIDVFYKDVFAELERIDETSSSADRQAAIDKLRALQKHAFDMLVKEKLAADESFRIFITLSNDAIDELTGVTPRRGL